jgi:hypothetical protein
MIAKGFSPQRRMEEFGRLEALQREVQAGIRQFSASSPLSRHQVHDRAIRSAEEAGIGRQ